MFSLRNKRKYLWISLKPSLFWSSARRPLSWVHDLLHVSLFRNCISSQKFTIFLWNKNHSSPLKRLLSDFCSSNAETQYLFELNKELTTCNWHTFKRLKLRRWFKLCFLLPFCYDFIFSVALRWWFVVNTKTWIKSQKFKISPWHFTDFVFLLFSTVYNAK